MPPARKLCNKRARRDRSMDRLLCYKSKRTKKSIKMLGKNSAEKLKSCLLIKNYGRGQYSIQVEEFFIATLGFFCKLLALLCEKTAGNLGEQGVEMGVNELKERIS